MRGWLQPPPQDNDYEGNSSVPLQPVFVELENLIYYAVDRTPVYRGYWVATSSPDEPLYWLQEPCNLRPPAPNNISQEDLHLNARVALAAVSLLCERVFTPDNAQLYVNMSVEEVLQEKPLLATTAITEDELFEMEKRILGKHKKMIAMHMNGHYVEGNCKFLTSLSKLPAGNKLLSDADMKWWTESAEKQCQQYPWGGPLPEELRESFWKRLNWRVELALSIL